MREVLHRAVLTVIAGALILATTGLRCNEGPTEPPDRNAPQLTIVFPSADGSYDRDGDGLVDIEIVFHDVPSGVDPASLAVQSSRPLGPQGSNGTDLLLRFRLVERDSSRVVLEETTNALLPSGEVEIVARVADRNGNNGVESRRITLPSGALHTRLELPSFSSFNPIGIVMLPDGSRGFVPMFDGRIVPFDPWSVALLPTVPRAGLTDWGHGVFDPGTQRVYLSNNAFPFLGVFDPAAGVFEPPIPLTARNIGVERAPSGLLYVALAADGEQAMMGVVDPVTRREIRRIELGFLNELNPMEPAWVASPRIPPVGDRMYVSLRVAPGGVLVVDLQTNEIRSIIDIDPIVGRQGDAIELVLDPNRGRLYATDEDGLSEVNIGTDLLARRISVPVVRVKFASLSPSGRRLFVSAGSHPTSGPQSWLVDVESFTIIERFSEGIPASGENRSAFRVDGQLVFVNSGTSLAVYLNRES